MNARRLLVLLCLVAVSGLFAAPAFATEAPATTIVGEQQDVVEGPAPAMTTPAPVDDAAEVDWTYKYLIPTLAALALVVVIFTTVQYFRQVVQRRYKVVEE